MGLELATARRRDQSRRVSAPYEYWKKFKARMVERMSGPRGASDFIALRGGLFNSGLSAGRGPVAGLPYAPSRRKPLSLDDPVKIGGAIRLAEDWPPPERAKRQQAEHTKASKRARGRIPTSNAATAPAFVRRCIAAHGAGINGRGCRIPGVRIPTQTLRASSAGAASGAELSARCGARASAQTSHR